MGTAARTRPKRLAAKLLQIRMGLALTQEELIARLDCVGDLARSNVTRFEQGLREPSLLILLRYARLANISTDVLIDDDLALPTKLLVGKNNRSRK